MSLQEEGPQEPHQETLQQISARIIQKAWRRYVYREVFKYFKELISRCNQGDPHTILKTVNPREAELLDAAAGVFIRFRLGGITFPPNIYYKIFTYRPVMDVCASSPKDYTQPGLKRPVARQANNSWPLVQEDRSGWYQRMENNSWRLFCCKGLPMGEPIEISANTKMDFHYSRLQRQQDVDKWQKKRKIEWLKQMYMREWRGLACSCSSEPSKDVPSCPPRLDPHGVAAVAYEDSQVKQNQSICAIHS
uniref:uncharacterized protein C11orf65 homolog isoform X3 n=1 Tax=Epinephelus lanceolatus TaxID=310571 RepID=UPI001447AB10|nr:uncharacterized protein C11orf65 homolog isoform X3 [Epinephelus lanceolatus]